jgi:hypothetical protein
MRNHCPFTPKRSQCLPGCPSGGALNRTATASHKTKAQGLKVTVVFLLMLTGLLWNGLTLESSAETGESVTRASRTVPPVRVSRASWVARKTLLKITGTSTFKSATLTLTNADTGDTLGNVTTNRAGRWSLILDDPVSVPCQVSAEINGQTAVAKVLRAPQDCDGTKPNAQFNGLTLTGPQAVSEGSTTHFTATAAFSNGSTRNVTSTSIWSVDPTTHATVDPNGILSANSVSGIQSVVLSARATIGSQTQEASLSVSIQDGTSTGSHADRISTFEGTNTCLQCHEKEATDLHGSVHYQWQGDTSDVVGTVPNPAGKLGGINDFCIYPDINWLGKLKDLDGNLVDGGCARCHVGLGEKPDKTATQAQLENIDCLVCHSSTYKRTLEQVGTSSSFKFVPDSAHMSVSVLQAAQNVQRPTKDNCLNCHSKSGGGDNFKRGDIEEAHRNPSRDFDVHLAASDAGGAGLDCIDCHKVSNHRIAGRGSDLRDRDVQTPVACTNCHSTSPHDRSDLNRHTAKVNCTVCHIPAFARQSPTDMERDWSKPGDQDLVKKLWDPHMVRQKNVTPEYKFFNSKSTAYNFGDQAIPGSNGRILMSGPVGDVTDPAAKLNAFKHHLGTQPIDPVDQKLLPLKIGIFFQTGDLAPAVSEGVKAVNWTDHGHAFANTERYLGVFHEVAPKENALSCNDCHGGARVNFQALGYAAKTQNNGRPLCSSCHESESYNFTQVHQKHVREEGFDCLRCHNFSRAN